MRMPLDEALSGFGVIDESLALAVPEHARYKRLPADLSVLNEPGFIALARHRRPRLAAQIDRWCVEHELKPNGHSGSRRYPVRAGCGSERRGRGVSAFARAVSVARCRVLPLRDAPAKWRIGVA